MVQPLYKSEKKTISVSLTMLKTTYDNLTKLLHTPKNQLRI